MAFMQNRGCRNEREVDMLDDLLDISWTTPRTPEENYDAFQTHEGEVMVVGDAVLRVNDFFGDF